MSRPMNNLWKLVAVAIGALVACQWTPPHSGALEVARRALKQARNDPLVVQAAPAELHDAQLALRRAERSWIDTRDDAMTSHLAYVAFQRVMIARNAGLQREAEERLQRAKLEGQELLATSAREARADAGAHALPVTLVPPPAAGPIDAQPPIVAPVSTAVVPTRTVVEDVPLDTPAQPAATPPRATRSAPTTLAPLKPSLPLQVQARGPAAKRVASARHDRKTSRHIAQRTAPRKGSSSAKALPPDRQIAASKPEVWYLEAQGRPSLAPLPAPAPAARTTSVADLRQQRRMQALYAGGHGQPE